MSDPKQTVKGEVHNYRNDYKYNYEAGQKANGEWQIKSIKIRSDENALLHQTLAQIASDIGDAMKEKGHKMVKPVGGD